ncbi:MAG: MBL fold metallo-hydrolase [Desulfocucumaceae bacterium]
MHISPSVRVLGNRRFNIYLAGSEQKVLVEGGVSGVVRLIKHQVYESGEAGEVGRLVLMHAHFDHVCGVPGLKGVFPSARTAASARAAEVLSKPSVVGHFFREDEAMTGTLEATGGAWIAGGACRDQFDPPQTIIVDDVIRDGAVWQLDTGSSLRFSLAPGHSPCGLMAYSPEEEVLFSSDSAGFPVDDRTVFPIFFDGYHAYVNTIRSMMDLPVKVLAGAHEEIMTGPGKVRGYLQSALDWAVRTRCLVEELAAGGMDREDLANRIFNQFYHGALKMYTVDNIMVCCRLIVRRSLEAAEKLSRL